MSPSTPWTPEDLEALARLYPDHSAAEVGQILGRAPGSVYYKATQLGISKSPAFQNSVRSGRIQRGQSSPAMKATQFKPGMKPWNTGVSYQAGGRSVETRFKKGQPSHKTMAIGSYRLVRNKDGTKHVERKVSNLPGPNTNRWKPVARLVWEAAHGPIPKGLLIVFKPGQKSLDPDLITLDRLECITRTENARRNHPKNRSPEYARLVQLRGAITRQVNRIIEQHEEATA